MLVKGVSEQLMGRTEREMTQLLKERHRTPADGEPDFTIRNLSAAADVQAQTTRVMSLLLGAVASVSLVVGGIGIMNIMLVSVTERTREIGLRLSVGARDLDVLTQFLVEAMVLSLAGGAIGILLGIGFSYGVNQMLQWPTSVTASSVFLSFGVAAAIGMFFGFYPARKAAALDPIEALRFE
jgi:putative ABC transport system permease protein